MFKLQQKSNKTNQYKNFFRKNEKKAGNKINDDSCQIHNDNKFISYCFDCNCHLCIECLKLREHLYHNKNNIIEIQPIQEELNIIEEIISYYKIKIDSLEEEKSNKIKNVNDSFIEDKNIYEKEHEEKVNKNSKEKNEELKKNENKYMSDIEEIELNYRNSLNSRKYAYERDSEDINNKYNLIEKKENESYNNTMRELEKENKIKIEEITIFYKKFENIYDFKRLNEIVYHTYNKYNDNYYNCININNFILSYCKDDNIQKNILKKNLDYLEEKLRKNEDLKFNKKKEEEEKEKQKLIDKYENQIKEINKKFEKEIKEIKINLENLKSKYENIKIKYKEQKKIIEKIKKENEKKEEKNDKEIILNYEINQDENVIKIFQK